MCIECSDQPASLTCLQCLDDYCDVCFGALHKKGHRALHKTQKIESVASSAMEGEDSEASQAAQMTTASHHFKDDIMSTGKLGDRSAIGELSLVNSEAKFQDNKQSKIKSDLISNGADSDAMISSEVSHADDEQYEANTAGKQVDTPTEEEIQRCFLTYRNIAERAKYIPMRLTDEERRLLLILEDALKVSEYTDKVDVMANGRDQDMRNELIGLLSNIAGMYTAQNPKKGRKLFASRSFMDNVDFFKHVFEIGRRHKIRNPDKMRTSYGKLMFVLMDTQQHLNLSQSFVAPIMNVMRFAESKGIEHMLYDEDLVVATSQIHSANDYAGTVSTDKDGVVVVNDTIVSVGKNRLYRRSAVIAAAKRRQEAATKLATKWAQESNGLATEEDVISVIASIGDNHSYLRQALYPVVRIREMLHEYFGENTPLSNNLSISSGSQGARLTHSHEEQFTYCDQTFVLWAEIIKNMFKLWYCAEEDMLHPNNRYSFRLTGQGPNRVQRAPRVGATMGSILNTCYSKCRGWIGSSAVHLGDNEVPNALVFIDKYTQVERILTPVVHCINQIDRMAGDPNLLKWFGEYYEHLKKTDVAPPLFMKVRILVDFYRHAFDGSGADNFMSAGSCIDGRLTSAWNWCNKIASKSYYSVFLVSGFSGFEGSWSE